MAARLSVDEQLRIITAGTVQVESVGELRAKLERGRPLRIKLGCDPSSPDLHVGHGTVLRHLRRMQDLGHHIVFIVGDFTARIGDPSGKAKTRPMLSEAEVRANAATYAAQVGKVLEVSRCEVRYNGEWFAELGAGGLMELTTHYTVARMLERDEYARRYAAGEPITIRELLYPLVQGYDSVAVQSDIEIGGTDQTFNLLVGRDIQRAYGQEAQVIMTYPLLVGLDGVQKMSKSLGNAVGITEPPEEMFGKLMSISDALMPEYHGLLLEWTAEQGARLQADLAGGRRHPMEAKAELARQVIATYHGEAAAEAAEGEFRRVFSERQKPSEMPQVDCGAVVREGKAAITDVLTLVGFAPSRSEARRLTASGAVSVGGVKVTDPHAHVNVAPATLLRVGKRRWAELWPGPVDHTIRRASEGGPPSGRATTRHLGRWHGLPQEQADRNDVGHKGEDQ